MNTKKKPRRSKFEITIRLYDDEADAVNKFMQDINLEAPKGQVLSYEQVTKQALFRTISSAYAIADKMAEELEKQNANSNTGPTEPAAVVSDEQSQALPSSVQEG